MKAVCWCGKKDIRVQQVPDPSILSPRDVIVKVTATTICGSDLHLYGGYIPGMQPGDILGHEMVGEVVDVGKGINKLNVGDRVVVVSVIACGRCWYCQKQEYSLCDNSNPNAAIQEKLFKYSTAGVFGYSHLYGGYAGAQAEYVRVPYADVGAFRIPEQMTDEQALSCSDIFPTGYMGAENCNIQPGDVVAVWGCGPVGLLAIKSAYLLGAGQVIAIDNIPTRLKLAAEVCGATVLNSREVSIPEALRDLTAGRGPDSCLDAVGMEAHGTTLVENIYERTMEKLMLQSERLAAIRQMILCCRKGGTISVLGVYAGFADKVPLGAAFSKGLRWNMGQQHGQRYMQRMFDHYQNGQIDPSFVYTHRMSLDEAPRAYQMFRDKEDDCVKVLLRP